MKKIDPTKNVSPTHRVPTHDSYAGSGPTVKHVEPMQNSTAIHHVRRGTPGRSRPLR